MKINLKKSLAVGAALLALGLGSAALADDDTNAAPNMGGPGDTNSTKDVDNSQMNQRDRDNGTRTPFEQGNSHEDIQVTRQLRKYVVNGTNNFSMMAQNIKIITRDGRVTLRGPVKTDEEKVNIDLMARQVAGTNNVNDLLEVKMNP